MALTINKWRRICSVLCLINQWSVYKSSSSLETCYQTIRETSGKIKSWVTWPNVGGGGKGHKFWERPHTTREWLGRFCSNFARLLCSMHSNRRWVAGLWSRHQMLCVRGWRHIFDSPRTVAHPCTCWVLVVIRIP